MPAASRQSELHTAFAPSEAVCHSHLVLAMDEWEKGRSSFTLLLPKPRMGLEPMTF